MPPGLLLAVGYGLLLPVIAILHVRHQRWRESGAILGTIGGASVVVLGIVAAVAPVATIPALFVRGVWWWTIGKMWWETALLPRPLGAATMALALGAFALAAAAAPLALEPAGIASADRAVLGAWAIALSVAVWGSLDAR
ncbi:MAG TPA: hypothetical protein VFV20_01280 [Candidatus Limnocylindria bacterium]|nr:hypothetical protein [Candidatus Limnocylindria bacterium]